MNDQIKEEAYNIPDNFMGTGRCFNGMFRTRNLVEGVILAALPVYTISLFNLSMSSKMVWTISVGGGIIGLSILGINGDSLSEFLINYFSFKKKKRISKYNPRIKQEIKPEYLVNSTIELPREKIDRFIEKLFNRQSKDDTSNISNDIYNPLNKQFFEDDLDQVDTPEQLKKKKSFFGKIFSK